MLTCLTKQAGVTVGRRSTRSVSSRVGKVVRRREGQVLETVTDNVTETDFNHNPSHARHDNVNFEKEKNGDSQKGRHHLERNAEKGVNRKNTTKTYDFLKEATDNLFNDGLKTDWTAQQLVSEWLRLLPTLSGRQQRDALRLADTSARDMIKGPRDVAFAQRTLELIRAWTRVGDAQSADSLLECLVEAYGHLDDPTIVNDIALAYASVITAWGNDGSSEGSLANALDLFKKMGNPPVEAYNGVLNAYGNRGLAIEATKFFRDMQATALVRPDSISFGTLMKAWTRSQNQDAQKHIDNLFEELKELYDAEGCPMYLMPNGVMFAIAMTLASPERATALLQEMCSMYEANRNEQLAPTVGHYMLAMRSWAKAGNPQEAERLLGELTNAYRGGNDKLQPGHECFVIVMDAFAKQGTLEGARKAEEILKLMEDDFLQRSGRPTINNYGYNVVMNAYVRTSKDSGKVEEIFKRMEEIAEQRQIPTLFPDKISYTTLMRAWKAEGKPGYVAQIENLLHSMESSEQVRMHPDSVTYSVVLDALGKSGDVTAGPRGESILRRMRERGITPNRICYNSILYAYTMMGDPVKAKEILEWMEVEASNGNESIQPGGKDYSACIRAFAKKGKSDEELFQDAISLFHVVKDRYTQGDMRYRTDGSILTSLLVVLANCKVPNKAAVVKKIWNESQEMDITFDRINYNTLLRACGTEAGNAEAKFEALELAVVSFQQMQRGPVGVDSFTFYYLMHCCSNLIADEDERKASIEEFFGICCEVGMVSFEVLSSFHRLVPESQMIARFVSKDSEVNHNRIPFDWKRAVLRYDNKR